MTQKEKAIAKFTEDVAKLGPIPEDMFGSISYMNKYLELMGQLYERGFNDGYSQKVIESHEK